MACGYGSQELSYLPPQKAHRISHGWCHSWLSSAQTGQGPGGTVTPGRCCSRGSGSTRLGSQTEGLLLIPGECGKKAGPSPSSAPPSTHKRGSTSSQQHTSLAGFSPSSHSAPAPLFLLRAGHQNIGLALGEGFATWAGPFSLSLQHFFFFFPRT